MFSINRRLSISKKLTLIYSSIVLGILIIFSIFTFFLIRNLMLKDSEEVISSNADIIANYLQSMPLTITKNLNNINLSQGIYYSVSDDNENILFSNTAPSLPGPQRRPDRKFRRNNGFEWGEGTISTNRAVNVNGKNYNIFVTKDFEDLGNRIGDLAGVLITISVLGIIVAFFSGAFLTRKLLRPIKDITKTAKEITSKSLSKRILMSGAKDELTDLADTFNGMIERLEVDFDKQKRFVSDASHELRTPLAVMHGHVNMLNRWGKKDPEQLEKSLKTLKAETESMNKLVENLLCLAKGDNDVLSIKKEEFKFNMLLKEITDEAQLCGSDINISYNCSVELMAYADYNKLKQVLRILLDNSIKFSKVPAQISIKAELMDRELYITVTDNGIGIPEESLPKIFDRFYRVDESRTKATGGTGLGLSIAKQIIELHGGRISAGSKLGEGTTVTIALPGQC